MANCAMAVGAICLALPVSAQMPTNAPAPPPAKCSGTAADGKPCPTPAPSAAQQFPYPGEQPEADAKPKPDQQATPTASAAANTQGTTPPAAADPAAEGTPAPSAAKQFPYPGEAPESSSSSSSSTSSSNGSSDSNPAGTGSASPDAVGPPLNDAGSEGENTRRRKLPKVTKLQSDDDREDEDLDVAKYYLSAGNPMASYLRSKDAVKLKPNDPEAHFSLAEAAAKLNKHDEAVAEFQAYLQLEPDGTHLKAAQRSLAELR